MKGVHKDCMACRLRRKKVQEQVMADLPAEVVSQLRPFEHLHLDLMGPFNVKGIGGQVRKCFKVWAAVFVCSAVKAVSVWVMTDYTTDNVLMAKARAAMALSAEQAEEEERCVLLSIPCHPATQSLVCPPTVARCFRATTPSSRLTKTTAWLASR